MLGFTQSQITEILEKYDSQPATITALQRKFKCPRWQITRVANYHGVGNVGGQRRWTGAEP